MSTYYLDTSALVKLYVQEAGSEQMLELASDLEQDTLAVLELTRAEARSAIRRREREGDFVTAEANRLVSQLDHDLGEAFLCQPATPQVVEEACRLLDRYPLKAYDALQLGGCIALAPAAPSAVQFVSADETLLRAAEAEGLTVLNPEHKTP